jgi:hypothetical protein
MVAGGDFELVHQSSVYDSYRYCSSSLQWSTHSSVGVGIDPQWTDIVFIGNGKICSFTSNG